MRFLKCFSLIFFLGCGGASVEDYGIEPCEWQISEAKEKHFIVEVKDESLLPFTEEALGFWEDYLEYSAFEIGEKGNVFVEYGTEQPIPSKPIGGFAASDYPELGQYTVVIFFPNKGLLVHELGHVLGFDHQCVEKTVVD